MNNALNKGTSTIPVVNNISVTNQDSDDEIIFIGVYGNRKSEVIPKISVSKAAKIKAEVNLNRKQRFKNLCLGSRNDETCKPKDTHSVTLISQNDQTNTIIPDFYTNKKDVSRKTQSHSGPQTGEKLQGTEEVFDVKHSLCLNNARTNDSPSSISVKDTKETQNLRTCGKDVGIEVYSRNCGSSSKSPVKNNNVSNSLLMFQNLIESSLKEENRVSITASSDSVRSTILPEIHNAEPRNNQKNVAISTPTNICSKIRATTSEKLPVSAPDPTCVITVDKTNSHHKDKVNNSSVSKKSIIEQIREVKSISAISPHSETPVPHHKDKVNNSSVSKKPLIEQIREGKSISAISPHSETLVPHHKDKVNNSSVSKKSIIEQIREVKSISAISPHSETPVPHHKDKVNNSSVSKKPLIEQIREGKSISAISPHSETLVPHHKDKVNNSSVSKKSMIEQIREGMSIRAISPHSETLVFHHKDKVNNSSVSKKPMIEQIGEVKRIRAIAPHSETLVLHHKDKVNNSSVSKRLMTEVKRIGAVTPCSETLVHSNERENLKGLVKKEASTIGGTSFIDAPEFNKSQVTGSFAVLNPNAVSTPRYVETSVYPTDCTISVVPVNPKSICKGTNITVTNVDKNANTGRLDCDTLPGSNFPCATISLIVSDKERLCASNASALPNGQKKRSFSDAGQDILNSPKKRMKPDISSNFADEDSNCFGDVENCFVSKKVLGGEAVSAVKCISSCNFDRLSPKQSITLETDARPRNKSSPLTDKTIPANIMYSHDQSSADNQQKVVDNNRSMDPQETLKTPRKNDIRAFLIKGSPSSSAGKNMCFSNKPTEEIDRQSISDKTPSRKSSGIGNPRTTPKSSNRLKTPTKSSIAARRRKLPFSDGEIENAPQHLSSSQKESQPSGKSDDDQIFIEDGLNSFTVMHFRNVIIQVLKNKRQDSELNPDEPFDDSVLQLLNLNEKTLVHCYFIMTPEAKELYLRMYNRKFSWHRLTKIKYDLDVEAVFNELEKFGFIRSDIELENLSVMLDLLTLNEMKLLCKDCHLHHVGKNKQRLTEMVLEYAKTQTTLMFGPNVGANAVLRKKVKGILGRCIRLQSEPRNLFRRLILMYFMSVEEEGVPPMHRMLQVERGELVYPQYGIIKMHQVFVDRDALIRYQESRDMETELSNLLCKGELGHAENMIHEIRAYFISVLTDEKQSAFIGQLPVFLRYFSAGSCCAYALHHSIDSVKKLFYNGNELAVDILEELLGQNLYLPHYRGQWYEQLAQLYQKKDIYQAVSVILDGMADELVDELHYYKLSKRGHRLLKGRNKILSKEFRRRLRMSIGDDHEELPPIIQVRAKSIYSNIPGHKAVYLLEDGCGQEKTYLSVEELAITHYRNLGFRKGVHAEGGIITTVFGLLFWDIIYELEVPDVFQNQYQSQPLDMRTGEFYNNRREAVDKRLLEMISWSEEEVRAIIEQRYTENDGKVCLINWKWFNNFNEVLDLIFCMGMNLVAKLCERLVKSFRIASTGFPDVVLWTPGEPKYKFVEVKGPGDRLAPNQSLWMKFLISIEANAELCYVLTSGSSSIGEQ